MTAQKQKEKLDRQYFMNMAILLAHKAERAGEVPIGAVIVRDGEVISTAFNMREKKQNALYHAEVLAIDRACKKLKSWRLDGCEMFVTLEPCQMCMGAIINARIKRVYFGASSTTDLNWKTDAVKMENKLCGEMVQKFFTNRRK